MIGSGLLESCRALLAVEQGRLVMVGEAADAGGIDGWVSLRDSAGEALWSQTYDLGGSDYLRGAARVGAADLVVVGRRAVKKAPLAGLMLRLDGDGALVWSKAVEPGASTSLQDVVPLGSGLLVAGAVGADAWIGLVDGEGALVWQRTVGLNDASTDAERLVPWQGGAVLVGTAGKTSVYHSRVTGLDVHGNIRWDRSLSLATSDLVKAVAVLPDGLLVAGATAPHPADATLNQAWLARLDAWGNAACGSDGACVGRSADGCDDGEACTLDRCDVAPTAAETGGCRNPPMALGATCGDGQSCGAGGHCG